jgi:hypothetical protein
MQTEWLLNLVGSYQIQRGNLHSFSRLLYYGLALIHHYEPVTNWMTVLTFQHHDLGLTLTA